MAKAKTTYVCRNCGRTEITWMGICKGCGEADTFEERRTGESNERVSHTVGTMEPAAFTDLADLSADDARLGERIPTGMPELDRVLGGGLVPASYIVLAGDPGAGKTTMASKLALSLNEAGKKCAYVSGEESKTQARLRFERLSGGEVPSGIMITDEVRVESIIEAIAAQGFDLIVIDSIQTVYSDSVDGLAGQPGQVRECAMKLLRAAKDFGTSVLLIGQVTKDSTIAGPRMLEHMVDCVLQFEGDRREQLRILRAIKNRFGTTDEIAVFEMTEQGLAGITDPSSLFLDEEGDEPRPGSCLTAVIEGTRPVLCEVQALVMPSGLPQPIRAARGIDAKRMQMLLAVLYRAADIRFPSMDVYVNVSGGLRIDDPGADLAVCLALASAASDEQVPLRSRLCAFGEVSLLGTVRPAAQAERRRKEAERLGIEVVSASPGDQLKELIQRSLAREEAVA